MIVKPVDTSESILGYTLRHRLGGGGYGEVWVAEAPGGLAKAIKIVYGYHDENRAQRELKSLNRVKEVRHPFLLSLERIDVVNGRLIVVTELAEKSLRDRYDECVKSGMNGVPRDELISYLRDTAEALDYLSESHSLQHLDIKPENLLLLSGHIKVADFGLVKDIHDGTQSLMAGLTPTYAPPELFDGRPTRWSDQYSLAIVFQEMLTGSRPFAGKTAAQLASQHLHGTPQLSTLVPADQAVLRRALAKDPQARFVDCRALVDELSRRRVSSARRSRAEVAPATVNEGVTTPDATLVMNDESLACVMTTVVERKLPPVPMPTERQTFRPTLFVGLGQTGTAIARQIRRRISERLGDRTDCPGFRVLCIDTDSQKLAESTSGDALNRLAHDEMVPIPLRNAMEYREHAESHLQWLSRRWIYNVPRSLQTEGIRPLGRLAFVDHGKKVLRALETAVNQICHKDAVKTTAKLLGMDHVDTGIEPRIVVIASISGGLGSGAVIDLAYGARSVLGELGYADDQVDGYLLLSTGRSSSRRDLAVANAFSCLSELHHFSHSADYPGEGGCGIPAFEPGPTFANTYVVSMGADPLPDEYDMLADNVAEYLFLEATSACGSYWRACRIHDQECGEETHGKMMVRTMGLCHSGGLVNNEVRIPASVVAESLLAEWCRSHNFNEMQAEATREARECLQHLEIAPDRLLANLHEAIRSKIGESPLTAIQREIVRLDREITPAHLVQQRELLVEQLESAVDRSLGIGSDESQRFRTCAKQVLDATMPDLIHTMMQRLGDRLFSTLDGPGYRVHRMEVLRSAFNEILTVQDQALVNLQRELRDTLQANVATMRSAMPSRSDRQPVGVDDLRRVFSAEWAPTYSEARWKEFLSTYTKRVLNQLLRYLDEIGRSTREVRQGIEKAKSHFGKICGEAPRAIATSDVAGRFIVPAAVLQQTLANLDILRQQLDERIEESLRAVNSSLSLRVRETNVDWVAELIESISSCSRGLVLDELRNSDVTRWVLNRFKSPDELSLWLNDSLKLALPHLVSGCGGGTRLTIAVPPGADVASFVQAIQPNLIEAPQVMPATFGDIVFCYDVADVSIVQIAAQLAVGNPDCVELVGRLHSRIDVTWTPIIKLA